MLVVSAVTDNMQQFLFSMAEMNLEFRLTFSENLFNIKYMLIFLQVTVVVGIIECAVYTDNQNINYLILSKFHVFWIMKN